MLVILIAAVIALAVFWFVTKDGESCPPPPKCDCSDNVDESYYIGYIDGINGTVEEEEIVKKEPFYDYEYQEGSKKYQDKTGSKFVKPVGGQCPQHTKKVTYGKHKGKCQRQYSWYDTYRGTDKNGKLFTCTGGRVAKNGYCVCDEASGKVWNGSKCTCNSAKGMKWDSKTRRCRSKTTGQSAESQKHQEAEKKKCPRFQKWKDGKCQCDYANGLWWNGKDCVCDTGKGFVWNGKKCAKK